MLPPLCPVMAAILSVSRFPVPSEGDPGGRMRRGLGFRAASWQHRSLDCGTLILNDRCGDGCMPYRWRAAAGAPGGWRRWQRGSRKEPPMAGACMVGEVLG